MKISYIYYNIPFNFIICTLGSIICVCIGFSSDDVGGALLLTFATIFYLYIIHRYILEVVRFYYDLKIYGRLGVLVIFDLKFCEWICIGSLITGLYLIDTSQNKNNYINHFSFSAGYNILLVWIYIVSACVPVMMSSISSTIVENNIVTMVIMAVGRTIAFYSVFIIFGILITETVNDIKEKRNNGKSYNVPKKRSRNK